MTDNKDADMWKLLDDIRVLMLNMKQYIPEQHQEYYRSVMRRIEELL